LVMSIAKKFGVDAQVIGRVEVSAKKELVIKKHKNEIVFT